MTGQRRRKEKEQMREKEGDGRRSREKARDVGRRVVGEKHARAGGVESRQDLREDCGTHAEHTKG